VAAAAVTWQRIVRQPQGLWLRRALFQIHLWVGVAVGLYILIICLSGSVLVYRNELYTIFAPHPVYVTPSGARMSQEALNVRAQRAHPGYDITQTFATENPRQAVEIYLQRGSDRRQRFFDPYTGNDLGNSIPAGFRFTAWLLDLHDNLLSGQTGRRVNAVGAVLVLVLAITGAVIWWPGVKNWRRSLTVALKRKQRFTWRLHSALGFWFGGFVVMWGASGLYLSYPEPFSTAVERLETFDRVYRLGERFLYWLGYSHFGRFAGRLPGCGPACGATLKAVWAVFGIVPVVLFVTGALVWWNRVLRRRS
jgi:uncharacterized iron-regulated membrane protein